MLLTVHDDIFPQIGTNRLSYDPSVYPSDTNPVFKAEATVSTGYTDISTIENFPMYGGETTLTTEELRTEIDALVAAKTFTACTAAEKDIASEWFVVDKSDRDTKHDAAQQEANAKILITRLIGEVVSKRIDDIKDADKTAVDAEIISVTTSKIDLDENLEVLDYLTSGTGSFGDVSVGDKIAKSHVGDGAAQNGVFQSMFRFRSNMTEIKIWVRREGASNSLTISLQKDGVVDSDINGLDIKAVADNTWEEFTLTIGSIYSDGDHLKVEINSQVDSSETNYISGIWIKSK